MTPPGFIGVDLDPIDVWLPFGVAELGRATINGVVDSVVSHADASHASRRWTRACRCDRRSRRGAGGSAARLERPGRWSAPAIRQSPSDRFVARSLGKRHHRPIGREIGRRRARRAADRVRECREFVARARTPPPPRDCRSPCAWRQPVANCEIAHRRESDPGTAGGLAAALAGYWTGEGLRRLLFPDARWTTAAFDDRSLVFTLIIALGAGLVAGLAPAVQLTQSRSRERAQGQPISAGTTEPSNARRARRAPDRVLARPADRIGTAWCGVYRS